MSHSRKNSALHQSSSYNKVITKRQTERLLDMVEHLPTAAVYRRNHHLMMNRAAEAITGYSRDELTTRELWFNKLYGERADEVLQLYQHERAAGFPKQTDPVAHRCKNGERRYIEYACYQFDDHEIWILHDVTKRCESEIALHDRTERLHAIMDNVAEAIVVINKDGVITDFNHAAVKLFGYSASEAIGQDVKLLMPSSYHKVHGNSLINYQKNIGAASKIMDQARELPGCRKDGSSFPLELTITQVDHLGIVIGIMRDLSVQKRLEKQVADISTQEQERIGQEIHDGLGQQLTGLSLMASVVKRHLENQDSVAVMQMDEIIVQLQQAIKNARILSHGLAPVPVTPEGLKDALTLLAQEVNNNMKIACVFQAIDPVEVKDRTSAMQIYRIVQEAVNNAVKYAHASKITIKLKARKNSCKFSIEDNGCGFFLDKINNDGMGLRIMRYRAGIIGGHLSIKSKPDNGTVVSFIQSDIS